MSGNRIGGLKAAQTNKERYGEDFYGQLGTLGGSAAYKGKKGFAANKERARLAGRKGGLISKRGFTKLPKEQVEQIIKTVNETGMGN
jgi:general stress protein YciG